MGVELRSQFAGLVTDPSAISAGESAITKAQNVVFRAPGIIEPRPSLYAAASADVRTDGYTKTQYVRSWPNGTAWFACTNASDTRVYSSADLTAPARTIATTSEQVRAAQLDGGQVWTFPPCLRMLDASADTTPLTRLPGIPRGIAQWIGWQSSALASTRMPDSTAIGYRICFSRSIDTSNGAGTSFRVVRGAPSDRYVLRTPAPGTSFDGGVYGQIVIPIASIGTRADDVIEVYRTATGVTPETGDPGDDMRLRWSYKITSADVTTGYVTFNDKLDDGDWSGPSLYTNASEEGLLRANYRVRTAQDVALYERKACYAGATGGPFHSLTIKCLGGTTANAHIDPTQTICSILTGNVTWTNTSTVITAVPANVFPYLAVGQIVTGAGAGLNADPINQTNTQGLWGTIVSWDTAASTITLDTAATATNTAPAIVWDWIALSFATSGPTTQTRYILPSWFDLAGVQSFRDDNGPYVFPLTDRATGTAGVYTNGQSYGGFAIESTFAEVHSSSSNATNSRIPRLYSLTGPDQFHNVQLVAEYDATYDTTGNCDIAGAENFAIVSCKPLAFSEEVGRTYNAGKSRATMNGGVADLWWSKLGEPESVPLANHVTIGDARQPILRVFGATDRLWVLKADGLFAVVGTGDTPESMQVIPVDPTMRMIYSSTANGANWATRLGDTLYAWTRRGIAQIDTNGVQYIDGPIATDIRVRTPGPLGVFDTMPTAAYALASERDGLVVFGAGTGGTATNIFAFVFNVRTGTWSTWTNSTIEINGSGVSADGAMLFGAKYGYGILVDLPLASSDAYGSTLAPYAGSESFASPANAGYSLTVNSVTGTSASITILPGSGILDGIYFLDSAGNPFYIVSISGANAVVDRTGLATGLATEVYWPSTAIVTFASTTEGAPAFEKQAIDTCLTFRRIRSGHAYVLTWRGRTNKAAAATSITYTYDETAVAGYPTTFTDSEYVHKLETPREQSRFTGIDTMMTWQQARSYFALESLTLTSRATTPKVDGRR